ncbi:phosphotransacetylase [Spiroplasma helicoides]|uniref:Phosphate acetyltransferase n=1 Tax=Spiroplasma helicoides TaxID=216938 RepID=A0A1B3SLG8_9MOLU|nr:phosphate acetyltransferase [Spiroplasma helicoides]AOG60774.1 phosphotransacetylase [Spiroplasma helicoides]
MFSIDNLKKSILKNDKKMKLVFPEGQEPKIVEVANKLQEEGLANVIMLFDAESEIANNIHKDIKTVVVKGNPNQEMVDQILEIRKGRLEKDEAIELVQKRNYYGAMLIYLGRADGMVCGLTYTTADTLRPALQIIKTAENYSIASSVFIMTRGEEQLFFTDCALNVEPNPKHLADIAYMAAEFAEQMDVKNVEVALLSYSTVGSGSGPSVENVAKAVDRLKGMENGKYIFDGEMQFDSAYEKSVRDKKYPNSRLTKARPDVYVFPELNAGNIGYKIAQRMAGFEAAGPFILGLNKPVNDLSRGATLEDIYNTSVVTIYQAIQKGTK